MNNYRPGSNLSFLSRVLEKIVVNQLKSHTNSSNTSDQYQSAYRKFHSIETALFKIHNDILDDCFGVNGKGLNWFKSYLSGRCQRIGLGECLSSKADLKFGVPQGSVLGPLLFTHYTTLLSSMISRQAIPHHLYANDSQLYVSFASGDLVAVLNSLQSCLASVQSWMSTNKLKLNPDKTEFFLIANKQQQSKYLSMFPMELFSVKTNPSKSAWNLGVIFDKNFTFCSHISAVCSSCFYHMRDLRRIHHHLDLVSAKLLATALVSSRLDYCN